MIEWISLYPWNDIRRGNGQGGLDILLGVVMLAGIISAARRWRIGVTLVALVYVAWLALQVVTFWVPYAVGASPRWQRIHAANFAQTIQWLPRSGTHLPPDASHFVLQLLLIATVTTTGMLAVRLWRGESARR